ncbi:MAG: histidine kinase N-terminal 7TM domain-containing protein [Bacillota bacterium]
MTFNIIPYAWVLIIAGLITTSLGIYAWRHRSVRGALPFAVSMAVVTIWCWGNALEMSGADLPTKLFWANVQYFAYAFSPVTLVVMVSIFTNNEKWINRQNILFLCIIPLITNMLVWSNEFHGLIRQNVYLDQCGVFPVVGKTYGPWFWVHIVYAYSLNLTAIFLLIKSLRYKSPLYGGQSLTILIGTVLIVTPNILYILGLSPARFDVTPVFMAVSGCIIAWGLFRYRLFDVAPVARAMVIDSMVGAVVVLDEKKRVLDLNTTAEKLLGLTINQALSRHAGEVFRSFPEALEALQDKREEALHSFLEIEREGRYYQMNSSSLADGKGLLIGQLLVIYDITEARETQQKLIEQQRNLAVFAERERLGRELHDSLGQVLGYVNIQTQALQQELDNGRVELVDSGLERVSQVARDAHAEVREFIQSMRGETSFKEDFIDYLQHYLERFTRNYGIKVRLDIENNCTGYISADMGVQLFRIIQEALTNVRKYADTNSAKISLMVKDDRLMLGIEDNGRGFNSDMISLTKEKSFGLKIMEERAREIGGSLNISSVPNGGTKVIVQLPVTQKGGKQKVEGITSR